MAFSYSMPQLRPLACHQGGSCHLRRSSLNLSTKSGFIFLNTRPTIKCAISMSDGQSGENGKFNSDNTIRKARKFWEGLPDPVKSFPWSKVQDNFIQFILDVGIAVIKYLSAPLLAVSALSEMSYCAHERKLFFVPIPLALGFVLAGALKETMIEMSPRVKEAEVPWHLIAIAILFFLLKLPGPYYPYWGRIVIPHISNGALLRVVWMMYLWYRMPKQPVNDELEQRVNDIQEK